MMGKLVLAKPQQTINVQRGLVMTKNLIVKQSPIILSSTAVGGVISTVILASKASIKATELVREAENKKGESLTITETIQAGWKPYVPTIISAGLTVGAIVASTAISQKRQAALAGLYALSETALKEYQEKIEEKYGSKDAQKVRDEINADRVADAGVPPWDDKTLPQGECLCFDKFSGQTFTSSSQRISMAASEINEMIYGGDFCASLNEFYGLIRSPQLHQSSLGDSVGWNIDNNCKPYFTSTLTSDMRPCLVLDWVSGHEPSSTYRDIQKPG